MIYGLIGNLFIQLMLPYIRYTQVVLVEPLEEKIDKEIREALKDQALIKFYGFDPTRFFAYIVPKKRKLEEIAHDPLYQNTYILVLKYFIEKEKK